MAQDKDLLVRVCKEAASTLRGEGVKITEEKAAVVIPSIAKSFIEQLVIGVSRLAKENGGEASVDFQGLFTVEINNRESEEGEKDGNRMIAFIPGPKVKLLSKDDDASEGDEE